MATFVIYAASSDGYINSNSATYATARSGGGTISAVTGAPNTYVGQYYGAPTYYVYEAFLQFDTSSVSGTVASATLAVYIEGDTSTTDFTINARAYDWGASLTTADFVAGASLSGNALRATRATSGLSVGAYNDFTSDSSFASNTADPVRLVLASDRTESNTAPTGAEYVDWYPVATSGTTQDPKLTIVTVDPSTKTYTADAIIQAQGLTSTYTADAIVNPDRWADTCTGTDSTNLESHTPTGPYGGAAASGTWSQWYPTSGFARLRITSNKLYSYTSAAIATTSEYRHSQLATDGQFSADFTIPGAHNDGGYGVLSLRHAGSTPAGGSGYQVYFSNGAYVTAGTLRLDATVAGSTTRRNASLAASRPISSSAWTERMIGSA